ncbi:MBL fold metallo-hydrolase [Tabrizicola sp.]|uniref:MBL fold metallo-hydrolase n=1 Tax=Tabrizicola sp. TaxID=2005166 RepID=UPI003F37E98F
MGWFSTRQLEPGVFVSLEPAVDPMFRAAIVTVLGRDRDLQFDFGCGLAPLRPALPLGARPVIAVASHAHVDHIGGLHEFADRLGHITEAAGFAGLPGVETFADEFRGWPRVVTSPPVPGWTVADWTLRPAPLTGTLAEGDRIDLGDRQFTVLHLPGHSPGGIGLLDERDGLFLSGDAIYDEELLDDLPGGSVPDYLATMERLRGLDCRLVIGGHGPEMDRARMVAVAEGYLRLRGG